MSHYWQQAFEHLKGQPLEEILMCIESSSTDPRSMRQSMATPWLVALTEVLAGPARAGKLSPAPKQPQLIQTSEGDPPPPSPTQPDAVPQSPLTQARNGQASMTIKIVPTSYRSGIWAWGAPLLLSWPRWHAMRASSRRSGMIHIGIPPKSIQVSFKRLLCNKKKAGRKREMADSQQHFPSTAPYWVNHCCRCS